MKSSKTAYLARPGFPALIEVQQKEKLNQKPLFVEGISIPLEPSLKRLIPCLGLENILKPATGPMKFKMGGQEISVDDLL